MNFTETKQDGILLEADPSTMGVFFPLLQRGVRVKADKGSSIKALLCDKMDISPEYVDQRIQTIFLDGKPVDDPAATVLQEGSRIALSAAMPGLAGATLRRDGFFAVMRSQITHRPEEAAATRDECFVIIRLFNLVIKELAPKVLAAGIWITGDELRELEDLGSPERPVVRRAVLHDGREVDIEELRSGQLIDEAASICVTAHSSE